MTERPILFSGEMVNAILRGEKSQTRRVIKPQPSVATRLAHIALMPPKPTGEFEELWWDRIGSADGRVPKCPYGVAGDRLWVREAWTPDGVDEAAAKELKRAPVHYRADGEAPQHLAVRWRPSIHMPRWASRITLEVTGVRVERVQDISQKDAVAEGRQCVAHFHETWDRLNAKRDFGWDANPWVWVIEFRRI